MSKEKGPPGLCRVHKGLYYPVMSMIITNHSTSIMASKRVFFMAHLYMPCACASKTMHGTGKIVIFLFMLVCFFGEELKIERVLT